MDPLDHLLAMCDCLRQVELLPEGHFKTLYRVDCLAQIHAVLIVLLLQATDDGSLTTYDHLKEARHN